MNIFAAMPTSKQLFRFIFKHDTIIFALLVGAVYVCIFLMSLKTPILDRHSFRQTQTAIAAQYVIFENAYLPYLTPIFGPPWSIPFEAPFYVWLVALLQKISGLSLDTCGRILSAASFFLTAIPIYNILKYFNYDAKRITPIIFILAASSTEYLFWSRSFLIETFTLLLCFMYLMYTVSYVKMCKKSDMILSLVFSLMATLMKVTTYFMFGVISLAFAYSLFKWKHRETYGRPFVLASIVLASVLAAAGWTAYGDHLKNANPLTQSLSSAAIQRHNWGTISQRFSFELWNDIVLGRSLSNAVGSSILFGVLVGSFLLYKSNYPYGKLFLVSIVSYILPFIVFSNLHIVHDYYQVSNALFLIMAASICLYCLKQNGKQGLAFSLTLLIIVSNLSVFVGSGYFDSIKFSGKSRTLQISEAIKESTNRESVLVIGADDNTWTSEYNYYSERKGIMFSCLNYKGIDMTNYLETIKNTNIESVLIFDTAAKLVKEKLMEYVVAHKFGEFKFQNDVGCKLYVGGNFSSLLVSDFSSDNIGAGKIQAKIISQDDIVLSPSFGAERLKITDGKTSGSLTMSVSTADPEFEIEKLTMRVYPKVAKQSKQDFLDIQYSKDNANFTTIAHYSGVGNDTQRGLYDPAIQAKIEPHAQQFFIRIFFSGSAEFYYSKDYPILFNFLFKKL